MTNSFELQGSLHEIFDTQQVTDKFAKREFCILVPDGSYTQYAKLQFTNDKCDLLDTYSVGDEVKVSFNLQGKPFTNKQGEQVYFTNLAAWKIELVSKGKAQPKKASSFIEDDDLDGSLPF